jgi:hypothetical protein
MFKKTIDEVNVGDLCCTQYIYPKRKNVMTNVILREGFKYDGDYIFVSKDNEIIDGNHRYCALMKLKGPNYRIKVKRVNTGKKLYIFTFLVGIYCSIIFIIFLFFYLKNFFSNL